MLSKVLAFTCVDSNARRTKEELNWHAILFQAAELLKTVWNKIVCKFLFFVIFQITFVNWNSREEKLGRNTQPGQRLRHFVSCSNLKSGLRSRCLVTWLSFVYGGHFTTQLLPSAKWRHACSRYSYRPQWHNPPPPKKTGKTRMRLSSETIRLNWKKPEVEKNVHIKKFDFQLPVDVVIKTLCASKLEATLQTSYNKKTETSTSYDIWCFGLWTLGIHYFVFLYTLYTTSSNHSHFTLTVSRFSKIEIF